MENSIDTLIIGAGLSGLTVAHFLQKYQPEAKITILEGEWGRPTDTDRVEKALKEDHYKVITLVHAETSTGVLQPMEEVSRLAAAYGAMILLDTVTSLGGVDVKVDEWGVDAAYSCSQKCIGCPAGLAPVTFSERAIEASRKWSVSSLSGWHVAQRRKASWLTSSKAAYRAVVSTFSLHRWATRKRASLAAQARKR